MLNLKLKKVFFESLIEKITKKIHTMPILENTNSERNTRYSKAELELSKKLEYLFYCLLLNKCLTMFPREILNVW